VRPENKITIRTATESDWPALQLLDSVGFGFHPSPAVSELTKALYKPEDIILAVDVDIDSVAEHTTDRTPFPTRTRLIP
ncbi:hypothetical protein, partial [Klebsiella pneumoniae]|uniref:hypothetical protein n=1 Tax=Klebsiella pneumoniae TaxID=573 RepID=UPI002731E07F